MTTQPCAACGAAKHRRVATHEYVPRIASALLPLAVPIDDVAPWPDNPRVGNVPAIAASLARFGQVRPIVVQASSRRIAAGNHLWRAAKGLGWGTIAAGIVDVSDAEARAFLVADNRMSDLGTYDDVALAESLRRIREEGDLLGTGYEGRDVDLLLRLVGADAEGYAVDRLGEWGGMPEFALDDLTSYKHVVVHFRNEDDRVAFFSRIGQPIPVGRQGTWYPAAPRQRYADKRYAAVDAAEAAS